MSSPAQHRSKATADSSLWSVVGIGLACRLGLLFLWFWVGKFDYSDVKYYWDRTYHLAERGIANSLVEYPTPVAWLLNIPQVLSGGDRPLYAAYFVLMMLLFDLALCVCLWRWGGPHRGNAINFWSLFQLFLGTLVWLRFDMIPAVLVGLAALFASRRPGFSGFFLGLGAAVKLWPAALLALFVHKTTRWRALAGFIISFGGLVIASIFAGGTDRLISPLTWQNDRGLQIESIWATPLMIARAFHKYDYPVDMSRYQAFEVFGPGREAALHLASVATVVGMLACVLIVVLHWLSGRPTQVTISMTMLMAISMIIVTNKTFSPQYVTWLAGPLAVLIARVGWAKTPESEHNGDASPDDSPVLPSTVRRWTIEVLAIALLSQLVYPAFYDYLYYWREEMSLGVYLGTIALVLRNAVVLGFTLDLTISLVFILRRRRQSLAGTPATSPTTELATESAH